MADEETIGDRLLALRKENRLTQEEMADRMGLSLRGWQKIERGEGLPNGETLLRVKTLGYNPGWVLSGIGPKHMSSEEMRAIIRRAAPMRIAADDEIYTQMFGGKIRTDLLARIWDVVRATYQSENVHLPRKLEVELAAACYNDLLAEKVFLLNDDEVNARMERLRENLLREIAEAQAEPGTGKPSA